MEDTEMWRRVAEGLNQVDRSGGTGEIRIIIRNYEAKHVNVSFEIQPPYDEKEKSVHQ